MAEVSEIATTQIGGAIDDVLDKINAGNEALDKLVRRNLIIIGKTPL